LSFDDHSADYARKMSRALAVSGLEHDFFFEAKVRHILEAKSRLAAGAPIRALELGCGIGLLQERLRPHLADLWGIDSSIGSLLRAAPPRGGLVAADGLLLPFADQSFDLVIAVCVLHHVPPGQRAAFLGEAARVLTRGGIFTVCEHNPLNPLPRLVVSRCDLDRDAVLLGRAEVRRQLREAGLSRIRSRYILFFPWRGALWRFLERLLAPIPLGAQFVVDAWRD